MYNSTHNSMQYLVFLATISTHDGISLIPWSVFYIGCLEPWDTISLYNTYMWIVYEYLQLDLCLVKMLQLDINHMDVIFTKCFVITFVLVWTTFEHWGYSS